MKKVCWVIPLILIILVLILFGRTTKNQAAIDSQKGNTNDNSASETQKIDDTANAMREIYKSFYGVPFSNDTLPYFTYLVGLGWDQYSFLRVISNSTELAATEMQSINSNREQPVFLNIGVSEAQDPSYAKTQLYREDGQYGIIIWLHLETSPAVKTPVEMWDKYYAYPVNHEMRHVKRFFKSGIFDGKQVNQNMDSSSLYKEYLNKIMGKFNISAKFNSVSTANNIDELGVVLETDNAIEIAANIDRLNSFTIDILKNDEDLGVSQVAPIYLNQIVLARHLSQAYAKPSVQRLNYSIRASAFDEMNTFSTTFRKELYRAYPSDVEAMQNLETIYEEEANKAILENAK